MAENIGNSTAHGRHRGDRGVRLVKISDLARMSGVPRPTIKHYMREGLLPGPAKRTSRNMAYYDARLAARIRAIKSLQKRHCLPLRVIGSLLEPPPSSELRGDLNEDERNQLGEHAAGVSPDPGPAVDDRPIELTTDGVELTRAQVLMSLRVTEDDLGLLHELGLLRHSVTERGDAVYTGADLAMLELVDDARASGLGALFGRERLVAYAQIMRRLVAAERDAARGDVAAAHELGARLIEAMRRALIDRG